MFLKSAQVTFHSHIPTLGGALSFLGCLHLAVDGEPEGAASPGIGDLAHESWLQEEQPF